MQQPTVAATKSLQKLDRIRTSTRTAPAMIDRRGVFSPRACLDVQNSPRADVMLLLRNTDVARSHL
eukprot:scaffold260876_cov14-Prasinocladus_malaysianus.AAC.1